jgi:outer membrane protein OmpA-like peptidoglycan-associated protein
MLMGVGLSGVNAQTANKALNDVNTLEKIENTLETQEIEKLAATLEKAGLDNALDKLENNAETIKQNFDKAAKKNNANFHLTRIYSTKNLKSAKSKVKQGYAVTDVSVTKDTVWTPSDKIEVDSTLEMVFHDNVFKTGSFDLEDTVAQEIAGTIESILSMGGSITSINIESSTDMEPIRMGNEKLAKLRANGVKKFITDMGVNATIHTNELSNQGPNVFTKGMSSEEKDSARVETAQYRYVKVTINSVVKPEPQKEELAYKILDKIDVTMVKSYITGKAKSFKTRSGKTPKPHKKIKKKKCKVNGESFKCFFTVAGQ